MLQSWKIHNKKKITREQADAILYKDFWKYNGINKLPAPLVDVVYDASLPIGGPETIKLVYKSLGLTPGNIIGPQTMKALEGADLEEVKKKFIENTKAYYLDQVSKDPSKKKFLKGWINFYKL